MNEPASNIGFVCNDHAPKPGKFADADPTKLIGSYCKLGFQCKRPDGSPLVEHMWVVVREVDGGSLKGQLDNDPIGVYEGDFEGLACGDTIEFKLEEIEDLITP